MARTRLWQLASCTEASIFTRYHKTNEPLLSKPLTDSDGLQRAKSEDNGVWTEGSNACVGGVDQNSAPGLQAKEASNGQVAVDDCSLLWLAPEPAWA